LHRGSLLEPYARSPAPSRNLPSTVRLIATSRRPSSHHGGCRIAWQAVNRRAAPCRASRAFASIPRPMTKTFSRVVVIDFRAAGAGVRWNSRADKVCQSIPTVRVVQTPLRSARVICTSNPIWRKQKPPYRRICFKGLARALRRRSRSLRLPGRSAVQPSHLAAEFSFSSEGRFLFENSHAPTAGWCFF